MRLGEEALQPPPGPQAQGACTAGHPRAGPGCLSLHVWQPARALSNGHLASLGTGVVCRGRVRATEAQLLSQLLALRTRD